MHVDEALRFLGNFGRYQTLVYILVSIAGCCFPAWQMMAMIFITDQPAGYRCTAPLAPLSDRDTNASYPVNSTDQFLSEEDGSGGGPTQPVRECLVNTTWAGNQTACTEWDYHLKYGEKTAVSDLDLVCDRSLLANTAQSIFFGGVLVGSLVTGTLSDLFGRKTVMVGALFMEGVFGVCLAFTWSYTTFAVLWFFVGLFEQGVNLIQFVLIMEMFSPEKRTLAGCINGVAWGLGVVLLSPFAYFLRNWRHLQIVISVPNLIASPILLWVAFESVRWLVSKERMESAERVLHRIARLNNIDSAPDKFLTGAGDAAEPVGVAEAKETHALSDVNENTRSQSGYADTCSDSGIKMAAGERPHAFRVAHLRAAPLTIRNGLIMCYSWFVSSMVYYGMSLNSSYLAGDKYLNFFLIALVEIPGYLVVYFMVEWWGRRPSLSLTHFIAGVSSVICACIPQSSDGDSSINPAVLAFALIGKFGITISFALDFLYGSEIFPTPIRNIGMGVCSFSARIGGILAPFVLYLTDVSPYIPLNVFGILSLLAAGLVILLPETRKRALPETLADGEMMARMTRRPKWPKFMWPPRSRRKGGAGYQPAANTA